MIRLKNEWLEADVQPLGGECVALRDANGHNYLWSGDPSIWAGISPLLFPIVGLLPGNTARIGGQDYTIGLHGFARSSDFSVIQASDTHCVFRLDATDATRRSYPFDFRLTMTYTLSQQTLSMVADAENRTDSGMPVSFGFHPGFCWPLPGGHRDQQAMIFQHTEVAPVRRPLNGLLDPLPDVTPVQGRHLKLHDGLFTRGAIVFDRLQSRSLRLGGDEGAVLHIEWDNLPHLGIWTKPGAPFVCIEPWQGYAAPVGFDGELADKPGMLILQPEESGRFSMRITVETDASKEVGYCTSRLPLAT